MILWKLCKTTKFCWKNCFSIFFGIGFPANKLYFHNIEIFKYHWYFRSFCYFQNFRQLKKTAAGTKKLQRILRGKTTWLKISTQADSLKFWKWQNERKFAHHLILIRIRYSVFRNFEITRLLLVYWLWLHILNLVTVSCVTINCINIYGLLSNSLHILCPRMICKLYIRRKCSE